MVLFAMGDIHGECDWLTEFCWEHPDLSVDRDVMILLGDVGANYYGNSRDVLMKKTMSELPLTFFCIHGNHEMRPSEDSGYHLEERFGNTCWVQSEYPNIVFPVDGLIFQLPVNEAGDTLSTLVVGGAYSVDKYYRLKNGWHWFEDEQPDDVIKARVWASLAGVRNEVDLVVSHTCPKSVTPVECFLSGIDQRSVDTSTEEFLDEVLFDISFKHWLCGHWHTSKLLTGLGDGSSDFRFMFHDVALLQ